MPGAAGVVPKVGGAAGGAAGGAGAAAGGVTVGAGATGLCGGAPLPDADDVSATGVAGGGMAEASIFAPGFVPDAAGAAASMGLGVATFLAFNAGGRRCDEGNGADAASAACTATLAPAAAPAESAVPSAGRTGSGIGVTTGAGVDGTAGRVATAAVGEIVLPARRQIANPKITASGAQIIAIFAGVMPRGARAGCWLSQPILESVGGGVLGSRTTGVRGTSS